MHKRRELKECLVLQIGFYRHDKIQKIHGTTYLVDNVEQCLNTYESQKESTLHTLDGHKHFSDFLPLTNFCHNWVVLPPLQLEKIKSSKQKYLGSISIGKTLYWQIFDRRRGIRKCQYLKTHEDKLIKLMNPSMSHQYTGLLKTPLWFTSFSGQTNKFYQSYFLKRLLSILIQQLSLQNLISHSTKKL